MAPHNYQCGERKKSEKCGPGTDIQCDCWCHATVPQPSVEQMEEMSFDGGCDATDGCWVEPDGRCEHGYPSWMLCLGYI
jgi:hypothetical protein